MRVLLIIALLLWPACFAPADCTMATAAATRVKTKMGGDCCKHGCDCSANPSTPSKQSPVTVAPADMLRLAPAPLLLVAPPSVPASLPHVAESDSPSAGQSGVRVQSILCHWTT